MALSAGAARSCVVTTHGARPGGALAGNLTVLGR
jgi:hypothetical protein